MNDDLLDIVSGLLLLFKMFTLMFWLLFSSSVPMMEMVVSVLVRPPLVKRALCVEKQQQQRFVYYYVYNDECMYQYNKVCDSYYTILHVH